MCFVFLFRDVVLEKGDLKQRESEKKMCNADVRKWFGMGGSYRGTKFG